MILTEEQIERLMDAMRSYGFDTSELDIECLDKLASAVLEALGIEFPN